jgi:PAS domain S-box-containing protein
MVYELRRAGFEPDWHRVDTEEDYLAHLDPGLDLILTDHSMPGFDSPRALSLLQERKLDIPLIVVTGSIGEEKAVELIKRGAADYLLKDRLARLGEAARRVLEEKRLRLEREQARTALEKQNQRIAALYGVSKMVNSTLNIDQILDHVADEAMRVTDAKYGQVLVVDALEGVFERRSLRGFSDEQARRAVSLPLKLDQGLNGQVYKTHQITSVDDVREQPGYYSFLEDTHSELVIPILRDDKLLGNIDLQGTQVGAFREVDTDYLYALAEQAALAITNARLFAELESYSDFLEKAVDERTQQLEATKNRVETILSSVGDALLVIQMNSRIEQVNMAFEHQTGYTSQEAEGLDHHDLLQLEFGSKGDYQGTLEGLTPGKTWHGQTRVQRKDGSVYDADITIAPVAGPQGEITRLVASIRDISPLKEVERAKDQFVSNVSHELRTPITSLRLNHNLLQRDPEHAPTYAERMQRDIDRLNVLIEDLLRLSRLQQGSLEMDLNPLDLNELAAQYVSDRTPLAENRGLSLSLGDTAKSPMVMADSGLLGQALSVLLTNALNYTPTGGSVRIGTHQRKAEEIVWAGFSVSDTGPGISPEEQTELFARFFRGSVGRNSGAPGTGLGLAIAKEIVHRHSGHIEVISEGIPGKGATFHAWLPAIDSK